MKYLLILALTILPTFAASDVLLQADTNGNVVFPAGVLKQTNDTMVALTKLDGKVLPEAALDSAYLSFLLSDKVNIHTWGITGDGTDETSDWNRMITNHPNPTIFFIPPATGTGYVVHGSIKYRNGHIFYANAGAGQYLATNKTTIYKMGSDTNALFTPYDAVTIGFNTQWRGVSMRGQGLGIGINLSRQSYARVVDCEIFNFDKGIKLSSDVTSQCYFNVITHNTISYNTTYDIEVRDGANVNWFTHNIFKGTPIGIYFTNAASINHVLMNAFQGVGGADPTDKFVKIETSGVIFIENNQFEVSTNAIWVTNSLPYIHHNTYSGYVNGQEVINYSLNSSVDDYITSSNGKLRWQNGLLHIESEWFGSGAYANIWVRNGNTNLTATAGGMRLMFGPGVTVPTNDWSIRMYGGSPGAASSTEMFRFDLLGDPELYIPSAFGRINFGQQQRIGIATNQYSIQQLIGGTSWVAHASLSTTNADFLARIRTPYVNVAEQASAVATPPSGYGSFYFRSTGIPYARNDSGIEYDLIGLNKQNTSTELTSIDQDNPGNSYYFGTDSSGTKGFFALPTPTTITNVATFAMSDLTTALTAGATKAYWSPPFAIRIVGIKASLLTASSGAAVSIDMNEGGVSMLSTTLTIDASETDSSTAATPAVISDTDVAADARITWDIDVEGTNAAGLQVTIVYTRI